LRDSIGPATAILYAYLNAIDISIYDGYSIVYVALTFQEKKCFLIHCFKLYCPMDIIIQESI